MEDAPAVIPTINNDNIKYSVTNYYVDFSFLHTVADIKNPSLPRIFKDRIMQENHNRFWDGQAPELTKYK